MSLTVKEKMQKKGMTNVEMILALRSKGVYVSPPMMSNALNGVDVTNRAKEILAACEEVLNESKSN